MLKDKKILLGALLSITTAPVQEANCVDGRPEKKTLQRGEKLKALKDPIARNNR